MKEKMKKQLIASWYAIGLSSDVECGVCGNNWNPKASNVDRFLLEFSLDDDGKVMDVKKKILGRI